MKKFLERLFGRRDIFRLTDVFTSSAATLNYIQRKEIETKLLRNIGSKGTQVVVYGHSGGGKTTLLEHIKNKHNLEIIESLCMKDTSLDDLIRDAFDKLDVFYLSENSMSESGKSFSKFKAEYFGISGEFSEERGYSKSSKGTRAVPIQITAQRLSGFLGEAGFIWLIDDFHKLEHDEKLSFSQMLKIFATQSKNYPDLKVICVGAERTAREVVDYDNEMRERIAEVHVPLMSNEEIMNIIKNGFSLLNAEVDDDLVELIAKYSNNLAAVAHNLCYHLCYDLGINQTLKKEIKIEPLALSSALQSYVENKKDSYKQTLDKALSQKRRSKYNNGYIILHALVDLGNAQASHAELLAQIRKSYPEYPAGNLTTYLSQLCNDDNDEILSHDADSNKYSFKDPFMFGYAQMVFNQQSVIETEKDEKSRAVVNFLSEKLSSRVVDYILKSTLNQITDL